jgi:hypothetical protein
VVTLVAPKVSVLMVVGSVLVVACVAIVAVPGLIGLIVSSLPTVVVPPETETLRTIRLLAIPPG